MRLSVLVDQYPALSETFVVNEILALRRIGHDVTVESAAWAQPAMAVPGEVAVHCLDDDGLMRRLADLAWLVARRPAGCLRDVRDRRRWRREEHVRPLRVIAPLVRRTARRGDEHLHAHFAAGVALDALRIARLLGLPYSVTAHAYEIFRSPRNLREKLAKAHVATGECAYSVEHLREVVGRPHADRVHVVPMGVDHAFFRRRTPHPGGRHVVAVGRMVEKKGFRHLLDAVGRARVDRLTLVGDGPLRGDLEAQVRALGIDDVVVFAGAQGAAGVRDTLETADVVVISAVPVADGDRDVLPLIAGEALAMEVPVVASDFVGLPEVVMEPWGRLVPPGDPGRLADAIGGVLDLAAAERVEAGRAGRVFVVATRDLDDAARRLTELLEGQTTGVR